MIGKASAVPWQRTHKKYIALPIILLLMGVFSLAIGQAQGLSEQLLTSVKVNYGVAAEQRLLAWQALINKAFDSTDIEKLKSANDFLNQASFVDDTQLWKKKDYWATPVEFLSHNAGDCEDFSIAKYFTLIDMGVSAEKLRITYVKALELNQAHMVLAYYPTPSSTPLILDNLINQIKPANHRLDLQPVYSFNAKDLWLSRTRNQQIKAGKPGQLGKWNELNKRINNEMNAARTQNNTLPTTVDDDQKMTPPGAFTIKKNLSTTTKADYVVGVYRPGKNNHTPSFIYTHCKSPVARYFSQSPSPCYVGLKAIVFPSH